MRGWMVILEGIWAGKGESNRYKVFVQGTRSSGIIVQVLHHSQERLLHAASVASRDSQFGYCNFSRESGSGCSGRLGLARHPSALPLAIGGLPTPSICAGPCLSTRGRGLRGGSYVLSIESEVSRANGN